MAIVELREYKLLSGARQQWLDWMKTELLPYQRSQGMKILSTYVYQDENGDDWFIWTREFNDIQHKEQVYADTYNDWWIAEIRPKVFTLLDQTCIRVRLLTPVNLF
ncbi:hypothetical protein [Shewanella frigidimarina]|uniref:NIPSNAP domain-containing protein n=1 Tax=Shewanella frigidimarina TaxID=56812 RepID=A0A106C2S2_SHEFR|nr:hypothetical protein [Shewanella frigidimarina]KVX03183.1 hypothetical protein AWJ07_00970 [Shewanella frigidimarina]